MTSPKAGRTISCFTGVVEVKLDVVYSEVSKVPLTGETSSPAIVINSSVGTKSVQEKESIISVRYGQTNLSLGSQNV